MKLEWNVYREDFNSKKIEKFNIFDHYRFEEDVKKALKKFDNKEEFAKEVKRDLQYYFWSKCEYEIVLTSWVPHIDKEELMRLNADFEESLAKYGHEPYSLCVEPNVFKKIDICEQVMLNFDAFVNYVWSNKTKFRKTSKKKETMSIDEANFILRNCGVLDKNNQLMPAYKGVLIPREEA